MICNPFSVSTGLTHSDRGIRVEYLPPYSPDLNPIEYAFSGMKAWLRAHRDEARDSWAVNADNASAIALLREMTFSVSRSNAFGWFARAGIC
jgi:hypothetical protein